MSCVIKQKKIINTNFRGQCKPKNVVCCLKAAPCHKRLMCCDVPPDYKVLQDMVVCFYLFGVFFSKMKKKKCFAFFASPWKCDWKRRTRRIYIYLLNHNNHKLKYRNVLIMSECLVGFHHIGCLTRLT